MFFSFQCNDGYCIDIEKNCNDERNCLDFSDENCNKDKCSPNTFYCDKKCLSNNKICNFIIDCDNTKDERTIICMEKLSGNFA